MDKKTTNLTIVIFTILGIVCITSGLIMPKFAKEGENIVKFKITKKEVASLKTNNIELNDMELEINQPLSVDVRDYIKNIEEIETTVLNSLKLDTSNVNIAQAGTYTYTVTYKKKKYNGTFTIKEKKLPTVESITLKNLSLEKGSSLSTDVADYIVEVLPDEVKAQMVLNLTNVNINAVATYQYSIIYNGKMYIGNITIYEPQPKIVEEKKETEEEITLENSTTEEQIDTENEEQN